MYAILSIFFFGLYCELLLPCTRLIQSVETLVDDVDGRAAPREASGMLRSVSGWGATFEDKNKIEKGDLWRANDFLSANWYVSD